MYVGVASNLANKNIKSLFIYDIIIIIIFIKCCCFVLVKFCMSMMKWCLTWSTVAYEMLLNWFMK